MIKTVKNTITTIFMVPTLKVPKGALKENDFINAFIKDTMNDEEYKDAIFLLFKPKQIDKFREFLASEYERTKSVIRDYDYKNGFVVVVYKLPSKFLADFELIKRGKYSKTSDVFKKEFPKTMTISIGSVPKEEVTLQYRIFNRTEDLVSYWENKLDVTFDEDQEVWNGFEDENEILTQERLKEYEQL